MSEARQQDKRVLNVSKIIHSGFRVELILLKQAGHFAKLSKLERGPRLEFNYSCGLADFCRGAAIAREFGGAESVEVTLLTEV